jgi:hypothetical protein
VGERREAEEMNRHERRKQNKEMKIAKVGPEGLLPLSLREKIANAT